MTLFETTRVVVRRLSADDAASMLATYGDVEAMRYVDDGSALSPEDCARWIELTLSRYETHGYGMSLAALKDSGAVLGFIGLVHPGGQPEPELKYALNRPYWGCGYATELARGMMDYARSALGLREVISTIHPDHVASRAVLLKAGFVFREQRRNDDGSATAVYGWSATD